MGPLFCEWFVMVPTSDCKDSESDARTHFGCWDCVALIGLK